MRDVFLQHLHDYWHCHYGQIAGNAELNKLRRKQFDEFMTSGLPTIKDEHWKYTNLKPIQSLRFALSSHDTSLKSEAEKYFLNDSHYRLVFINGLFAQNLSLVPTNTPKFILASLHDAIDKYYEYLQPYLNEPVNNNPFAKLNTACMKEGTFIFVPKNFIVDRPIHILNINSNTGESYLNNVRNIIVAEPGARVTILEEHLSTENSTFLTNTMTHLHADVDSNIHYTKIQKQASESFHMGNIEVHQKKDSNVEIHHLILGAKMGREDITCDLDETGAAVTLQGLYLPLNRQHIDVHSYINHNASHTTSEELYKGIIANESPAVFNGKIRVAKNIKQVIANLQNKNLLISPESEVNTKPELEIYSDDVKCRHGATVGQLDRQMLFYLQSRGIALETAYRMLLTAFISDNLATLPHPHTAEQIKNLVTHYCEEEA